MSGRMPSFSIASACSPLQQEGAQVGHAANKCSHSQDACAFSVAAQRDMRPGQHQGQPAGVSIQQPSVLLHFILTKLVLHHLYHYLPKEVSKGRQHAHGKGAVQERPASPQQSPAASVQEKCNFSGFQVA